MSLYRATMCYNGRSERTIVDPACSGVKAMQKQIVTITTEQVRDLEATWREGVAKLEAWKQLFSSK